MEENLNNKSCFTGSCLCSAIHFTIKTFERHVVNCHCTMCAKQHGSFGAYANVIDENMIVEDPQNQLHWYGASTFAKRGFCKNCGSGLFWKVNGSDTTSVQAGSLDHLPDNAPSLKTIAHIFVDEKAQFYEIMDDLKQFGLSSNGGLPSDFNKS